MIIYGSRAAHLLTGLGNPKTLCPHCGAEGDIEYQVFRRHAHLYWIPFFPLNKVGIAQCNSCQESFEVKSMSEDMLCDYREIEREAKGKLWQWTGVLIILAAFFYVQIRDVVEHYNLKSHLNEPQIGDVYEYVVEMEEEGKCYSLMKVVNVTPDSVYLINNEYYANLQSALSDIEEDEKFLNDEPFSLAKGRIKELYWDKTILKLHN